MGKRNKYGYPQRRNGGLTALRFIFSTTVILSIVGLIFVNTKAGRICLGTGIILVFIFAVSCAVAVLGDE